GDRNECALVAGVRAELQGADVAGPQNGAVERREPLDVGGAAVDDALEDDVDRGRRGVAVVVDRGDGDVNARVGGLARDGAGAGPRLRGGVVGQVGTGVAVVLDVHGGDAALSI